MKLINAKEFLEELKKYQTKDVVEHYCLWITEKEFKEILSKHLRDLPENKATHPVSLEDVDEDSENGVSRALMKARGYNQCLKDCENK